MTKQAVGLGLWAMSWMLLGCETGDAGAESYGEREANGGSGAFCDFDDECAAGYRCFQSQCVYQGTAENPGPGIDAGVLPEENESETSDLVFTPPSAGLHHVWVSNPGANRVLRIDGRTLEIRSIEVGDEPTVLRTRAGVDTAIVLNRGSDEISRVVLGGESGESREDEVTHFRLPHHFNALDLSPDGRFAIAWLFLGDLRSGESSASVQDVAIVDLVEDRVYSVAIGFRPRKVLFPRGGERAVIVTDDDLSVLQLDALDEANIARSVPLSTDVFAQTDREVVLTPDGVYAASRRSEELGITIVELEEGVPRFVDLGAVPTDIDLLPDERTVVVMLRDAEALAFVPLADAVDDPSAIERIETPGFRLGSAAVAPSGDVAVLYTTALELPQVTLIDLVDRVYVHRPLRKGVAGVAIDPTGATAYVLHTKAPGEPDPALDEETFVARSHGYSLLNLRTTYAKLETTPAAPSGLLFREDGGAAYVLISDPERSIAQIQIVSLDAFEIITQHLGRPPEAVGVLASAERIFVTQTHTEGRISFIDYDGRRIETVSGYALNEQID